MQNFNKTLLMAAAICPVSLVLADEDSNHYFSDSHAPAGVMADHLHAKGEWMLGYLYMQEESSDIYNGSSMVSAPELAAAGYAMAPTAMSMEMHMPHLMYAPSDNLTLMLMPQYMTMDMSMTALPTMAGMDNAHAMHGMGTISHRTSGLGDTQLSALLHIAAGRGQQMHLGLGVSAPTGSVEETNPDGSFVHYGMQTGTGTWDFMPSFTWKGVSGRLSWGAQMTIRLPMEERNDSGYALGEQYNATTWSAWRVHDWLSVSMRLKYRKEGDINGHYNAAHNHSSPPDRQGNYGGEFLDYAAGINVVSPRGLAAGLRLGLEWTGNLSASYNGYQLGRENGLLFSISRAY